MLEGVVSVPDMGIANSHREGRRADSERERINEIEGVKSPDGLTVV
jgi:hypothetical protein